MNIAQIEVNVSSLVEAFFAEEIQKSDFIYELLLIYGHRKQSVTRLRSGERNMASKRNEPYHDEIIWKRHLYFKHVDGDALHAEIDQICKEKLVVTSKIRFVIVTNFSQLLAVDTKTSDSLDIGLDELPKLFDFFLPCAGMEKAVYQGENPVDVKAAEKMAKLFDLIKADNVVEPNKSSNEVRHKLNVFLTRLLFCFFAEDTEIFAANQFSLVIISHTNEDGSDLSDYLDRLFRVLNIENSDRTELPDYLISFPYVNGGLFSENLRSPSFSAKSRRMLIECGSELDWSEINPDIFGSMIQAVAHPDQRGGMGMHYTSVINIMKVIEPLFLNDLYEELEKVEGSAIKLQKLQRRLGEIKIFDPACGSGNFLIIAYKELRKLEMELLKRLQELESGKSGQILQSFSVIKLSQFYGIELDDFAHEVAILSLWLAEHQMNVEFKVEFGEAGPSLPLKQGGNIYSENALRVDWGEVCPCFNDEEIYILGNPPYLGAKNQSSAQKEDMRYALKGITKAKNLDYISCWFIKAARYLNERSCFAFVSTNSLCQGTQVPLIWPLILERKFEIYFAYKDFRWTNNAKNEAGVTCSIIGVRNISKKPKTLYLPSMRKKANHINAYLIDFADVYVNKSSSSICGLPKMQNGNQPYDGGFLIFDQKEKESFISEEPKAEKYFKKLVGSNELIKGFHRWCLWIEDGQVDEANQLPLVKDRIDRVRKSRENGGECARSCMERPHQFRWVNRALATQIVVPLVSSERRRYIPISFIDKDVIINNLAQVIFDPDPYIFSIINSRIHLVWVQTISGKLESRIRYSSGVCYNTFPLRELTNVEIEKLRASAFNILSVREKYAEKTLAELYDPEKMPSDLLMSHTQNDQLVDSLYSSEGFENDESRLKALFGLYKEIVGDQDA